jgi:hypothetical protein
MVCSKRKFFELTVKSLLFLILLFLYYYFYMDNALIQYYEKRTTMAESIKQVDQLEYPVLIFCPEPGFKPSFFEEIKSTANTGGIEKYIWKFPWHKEMVLKNVPSIPDVYNNMSYKLGKNWRILLAPYSLMKSRNG